MHSSCHTTRNTNCRRGDRRARDSVGREVRVSVKTRLVLVLECHPEFNAGYHLHVKLPDMGGRTNVLIGYNPEARNRAERFWYIFHETRKEGCPPPLSLNPEQLSNSSRVRIYKMAGRMLGKRNPDELRGLYGGETARSLLTAEVLER